MPGNGAVVVASAKRKPKTVKVAGENVYPSRRRQFRGITKDGSSGPKAGAIANASRTKAQRSAMARKGWRTRKG